MRQGFLISSLVVYLLFVKPFTGDIEAPAMELPADEQTAELECAKPEDVPDPDRAEILKRTMPKIRRVIRLLEGKPPQNKEALAILTGIRRESESLVEMDKSGVAVFADLLVGTALHNKGYHELALPFIAHALLLHPRNELGLALLVSCHLERSDLVKARKWLEYALKKVNSEDPDFVFLSGRLFYAESKRGADSVKLLKAIERFEAALNFGFDDPDLAGFWLAMSYRDLNMPEKALEQAGKIDPSKLPPEYGSTFMWHMFVAALYADMKQWGEAAENVLRSLQGDVSARNQLLAYCTLAAHYNNAGSFQKAIEYAKKVIASEMADGPMLGVAHCAAADAYRELGDLRSCIEHATKSIRQEGVPPAARQTAYYYLGCCYKKRSDKERSRQMFQRAIEVDPKSSVAQKAQKCLDEMVPQSDKSEVSL